MVRQVLGATVAALALGVSAPDIRANHRQSAEVVIEWNQLLQTTIPATAG